MRIIIDAIAIALISYMLYFIIFSYRSMGVLLVESREEIRVNQESQKEMQKRLLEYEDVTAQILKVVIQRLRETENSQCTSMSYYDEHDLLLMSPLDKK